MEVNTGLLSGNLTFPSNEQSKQKPLLHDLVLDSAKRAGAISQPEHLQVIESIEEALCLTHMSQI